MIEKIISGGQTGAGRAALDAAVELDIPHGGWVPKYRTAEDGVVPKKYNLKEMPTSSYTARTKQNVLDSDGTLIISHGELTGGSALTQEYAEKRRRHYFHVDLDITPAVKGVIMINHWIELNEIKILNVSGPRSSKDPMIYQDAREIIDSVCYLGKIKNNKPELEISHRLIGEALEQGGQPETLARAVNMLILKFPLRDKVVIASMEMDDFIDLRSSLGNYIRHKFEMLPANEVLMKACKPFFYNEDINPEEAASIIIMKIWEKLREPKV